MQENIKSSAWCNLRALLCYGPFPQTQNIQTRVVLFLPCPSQASLPPHFHQWHRCSSCSGPASSESLVILPIFFALRQTPGSDTRRFSSSCSILLEIPMVGHIPHFALRLSTLVVLSCHSPLPEPPVDSPGFGNWCLPFSVRAHLSLSSTSVRYFLPCGPVLPFTLPAGCPPLLFSSPYRVHSPGHSQCHVFLEVPLSVCASLCLPCASLLPFPLLSTSYD